MVRGDRFQNPVGQTVFQVHVPVIDRSYPLAAVHQALDRLDAGEQFGKLALAISGDPAALA